MPAAWQRFDLPAYPGLMVWFALVCVALIFFLYAPHSRSLRIRLVAAGGALVLPFVMAMLHHFSFRGPFIPLILMWAVTAAGAVRLLYLETTFLGPGLQGVETQFPIAHPAPIFSGKEIAIRRWFACSVLPVVALYFIWHSLVNLIGTGYTQSALRQGLTSCVALTVFLSCLFSRHPTVRLLVYGSNMAFCVLLCAESFFWLMMHLHNLQAPSQANDLTEYRLLHSGNLLLSICCAWLVMENLPKEIQQITQRLESPLSPEEDLEAGAEWDERKLSPVDEKRT